MFSIIAFFIGLFWAGVFTLRALVEVIRVGPSKYFYLNRNAPMPKELNDPKYGEHRIVNLGKIKIHYVISGPEGAPLMLMLHGFPEVWFSWRHQITEFQRDFRVVAADMRGFGDSDKPKKLEDYKLNVLVEDVRLLIEALGYKSCVLVGHDWGGGVAFAVANKHPDLVDRLVSLNMCPVPIWHGIATSYFKQFICSGYIFFFFLPYWAEFLLTKADLNFFSRTFNERLTGLKSGPVSDDVIECYKYYYRRPGAFTPGINYYRSNLTSSTIHHPLVFPMPVHVVWGMGDVHLTPRLLEETEKAVPHVTTTRIKDCSHWVQNDRPGQVNSAIRNFLEKTEYKTR